MLKAVSGTRGREPLELVPPLDARKTATCAGTAIGQVNLFRGDFCSDKVMPNMITSFMLNKVISTSAHMFFMMGAPDFFAPSLFRHAARTRACAQHAPAHRRAWQRAQVQLFHHAQAHDFLQHV